MPVISTSTTHGADNYGHRCRGSEPFEARRVQFSMTEESEFPLDPGPHTDESLARELAVGVNGSSAPLRAVRVRLRRNPPFLDDPAESHRGSLQVRQRLPGAVPGE